MDVARGVAILAMVAYHFSFDLRLFGFVDWPVTTHPAWRAFAASIASTFLFLSGVSLTLAHGHGVRWRAFVRRLAILALAAAAVTVATLIAMPQAPVFYGILHAIALGSLLGLPFVFAPAALTLGAAVVVFLVAHLVTWPALPILLAYPLGTLTPAPITVDYEPLFPWQGALLLGIAFARALPPRNGASQANRISAPLAIAGRWSLLIYLAHQPVLFAALALAGVVT